MAEFSERESGAYLFDAAFVGDGGGATDPVCLIAHALIGCSLATNATLYRAFARRLGRLDASPAGVVLLDQSAFGQLPNVDLHSLPPGADLGIAYALFVNHPAALAAAAADVFGLIERQLFSASDAQADPAAAAHGVSTASSFGGESAARVSWAT